MNPNSSCSGKDEMYERFFTALEKLRAVITSAQKLDSQLFEGTYTPSDDVPEEVAIETHRDGIESQYLEARGELLAAMKELEAQNIWQPEY